MTHILINCCPPSVNHSYRAYRGRVVLSKRAREFKEIVAENLPEEFVKITGKVKLDITFSFKDRRKRDIDNYLKVLLDSLKGLAFEDDDQIYELTVKKHIGCTSEGVDIWVEGLR